MTKLLPKTELWFIDVRKYVFDSLSKYVSLIQKIGSWKVFIFDYNMSKEEPPFVVIQTLSDRTDYRWIRTYYIQIDIYDKTIERSEEIKDIIIDLFNRRNFHWISSKLESIWPDTSNPKKWRFRQILRFNFVVKDMKF